MKKLIILALLLAFSAASAQTKFSTRTGGHEYTLSVPDYMVPTYSLNDVASLQYQNTQKEAYVIVIEDNKERLKEYGMAFSGTTDFLHSFVADYNKDAENRSLGEVKNFNANGYEHAQQEMRWTADGNDFFMIITVVETPTHYYKIMTWTLAEKEMSLKPDFLKISSSLKD